MRGHLRLEYIGAATADKVRQFMRTERHFGIRDNVIKHPFDWPGPCVLRMLKDFNGRISWEQVYGRRDYSQANSKGTRGVYVCFVLDEGELYSIKSPQSWKSCSYYYAAVTPNGDVVKVQDDEAKEWLNAL